LVWIESTTTAAASRCNGAEYRIVTIIAFDVRRSNRHRRATTANGYGVVRTGSNA
jgi:hypothetical protein